MAGASSSGTYAAVLAADPALAKAKAVPMGPSRLQIANRLNGASRARKLALLLTTKPFGKRV